MARAQVVLTGKDGLERNAAKLRDELDDTRMILLPHRQRKRKESRDA